MGVRATFAALLGQLGSMQSRYSPDKPYFLRLVRGRFGEFRLEYSSRKEGPFIKLCPLNPDQASWVACDGWPIINEEV